MANTYPRTITANLLQTGLVGGGLGYRVVSSVDGSDLIPRTTTGITEPSSKKYKATIAAWDRSWIGTILWEDANGNILAWEDFLDSDPSPLIWSALLSSITTSGSVGLLFKGFLNALGVDSRPKISADVHTGGATIAAVADGVDLSDDDRETIQATKTSVDKLVKGSENIFATGTIVDPSPSTRGFLIMLDAGQTLPDDMRYVKRGLWFNGDPTTTLAPGKNKITGYERRTADTAYVSFTLPWSGIPANGSTFQIG